MADVTLDGVEKSYGAARVVNDVSLQIADGEFCVFVGPSGCGKSTLLRMVAGLEDITSGELRIGRHRVNELAPSERNVAMVFQNYALYPHMNVAANLGFGLRLAGVRAQDAQSRVQRVARMLQIDHLLQRKPKDLSGGQRQRVAIGRALVREPGVFLFDEPLSNLDAALRTQTRLEIAKLHRTQGRAATIYVTHDQVEAMTLADRMVLLQPLQAGQVDVSVAQVGRPLDLYHAPRNLFVAGFLGSPKMNFLPGRVVARSSGAIEVTVGEGQSLRVAALADGISEGDSVTVGVRAEHLRVHPSAGPNRLRCGVQWMEHLGDHSLAYLQGPGDVTLVARLAQGQGAAIGDAVYPEVPAELAHLFSADGNAVPRKEG